MQNILIRLCSQGLGATDINNPPPRRAQVSNLGREDRGLLLKTEVNGRSSRDTPPRLQVRRQQLITRLDLHCSNPRGAASRSKIVVVDRCHKGWRSGPGPANPTEKFDVWL